ncbi:MAG: extensin family protein [Polyangiaceae bacterium]
MQRRLLALFALAAASGCAREHREVRSAGYAYPPMQYGTYASFAPSAPAPVPLGFERPLYAAYAPPGSVTAPAGAAEPVPGFAPPTATPDVPLLSSGDIPGGEACVEELARAKISFRRTQETRGVATPVETRGTIAGISYVSGPSSSMVADCRLVVALARIAPVLSELGVTALRFSGAYSYRMSRVGRLSLHAYGLAIDVHELRAGGRWYGVESDFARGLADGCAPTRPVWNQVACRLKATHLFKELLTPDYNADHQDHVHLAIAPEPGSEASQSKRDAPPRPRPSTGEAGQPPQRAASPTPLGPRADERPRLPASKNPNRDAKRPEMPAPAAEPPPSLLRKDAHEDPPRPDSKARPSRHPEETSKAAGDSPAEPGHAAGGASPDAKRSPKAPARSAPVSKRKAQTTEPEREKQPAAAAPDAEGDAVVPEPLARDERGRRTAAPAQHRARDSASKPGKAAAREHAPDEQSPSEPKASKQDRNGPKADQRSPPRALRRARPVRPATHRRSPPKPSATPASERDPA